MLSNCYRFCLNISRVTNLGLNVNSPDVFILIFWLDACLVRPCVCGVAVGEG